MASKKFDISPFDASVLSEIAYLPRDKAREMSAQLLDDLKSPVSKSIGKALLAEPGERQSFKAQVREAAEALENQVVAVNTKIRRFEREQKLDASTARDGHSVIAD